LKKNNYYLKNFFEKNKYINTISVTRINEDKPARIIPVAFNKTKDAFTLNDYNYKRECIQNIIYNKDSRLVAQQDKERVLIIENNDPLLGIENFKEVVADLDESKIQNIDKIFVSSLGLPKWIKIIYTKQE